MDSLFIFFLLKIFILFYFWAFAGTAGIMDDPSLAVHLQALEAVPDPSPEAMAVFFC